MYQRDPASFTVQELQDPNIPPALLGQIAAQRRDLWPTILHHPNCYPELAEYIKRELGHAGGQINPGQMSTGAVAGQPYAQPFGTVPVSKERPVANWPSRLLLLGAVLAAVSTFLPVSSVFGLVTTYRVLEVGTEINDGQVTLILSALLIVLSVVLIRKKGNAIRIWAGVLGLLTAGWAALCFSVVQDQIGHSRHIETGAGMYLLALAALVLLVSSIANFVRRPA